MQAMILASLILNIAVLVPICAGIMQSAAWAEDAYGPTSGAHAILVSVYLAILIVSVLLLILQDPKLVAALLLVQIVYKVITPIAVGTLTHPVVISNLFIAAFHTVTLFLIWRTMRGG